MKIPENIKKEHIEKAIHKIEKEGIPKNAHSSTYDVSYKNKLYPPKLIVSYANIFANSIELDRSKFKGGKGTPAFELLKKEGFEIIQKTDPIKSIIEDYKILISKTELKDEIYKWELINQNIGRPNPEVIDFYKEIKSLKFKNLIYAMGMAVIKHLAKERPEKLRLLFINLYDESKDLTERVKFFNKETLKLYRELEETLHHHQDERSIATYLTFHNPNKYTLYKASLYKKYCNLLNIDTAKKNEKFTHYLMLIDNLIEKYIKPDIELIEQVKGLIPDFYDGTNHKLLAQDILYQMVDKIDSNNSYSDQLIKFLDQAKTSDLKTKHFSKVYDKLQVKVSFGQGVSARIPWISFLKKPFTTSEGIYPVYLYYKNINKLVLSYGVSETKSPKVNWEINNPIKIKDYFSENSLAKPDRYGDSYLFKIYDSNDLPSKEKLDKDLNVIIEQYLNINMKDIKYETSEIDFNISTFHKDCTTANLKYSNQLVTRYISSLATKPFVLLSGLSGSGKTKLAQSFAQWICEDKSQYCIVPVGADWTNREPLLGYENALDNTEYILPENGALQLIIKANDNQEKPYFLILDEMNLSHVERYFADFLSVMESNDKFKLHSDNESKKSGVPHELGWPKNLFVVGTVNIDETTYMFSPKVLDRANVIEFRINESEMSSYLEEAKTVTDLNGEGATMGESFVKIAENKTKTSSDNLTTTLNSFFIALQQVGAEFGYRTASEIQTLFSKIDLVNPAYSENENEKIDIAIMQKLLPKLHGSRSKLVPVLKVLAKLCYQDHKDFDEEQKDKIFETIKEDTRITQYPLSLEKITRMYDNVVSNGFTSYAEA